MHAGILQQHVTSITTIHAAAGKPRPDHNCPADVWHQSPRPHDATPNPSAVTMYQLHLTLFSTPNKHTMITSIMFQGCSFNCLQHSTLMVGWQEGRPACKKMSDRGVGMVISLERGAD